MKTFLAVFTGGSETMEMAGWNSMEPIKRQELEAKGMKAWGDWMAKYKEAIVVEGGPIGKTKGIDKDGIKDIKNMICAYVVVKAQSHEEAAKMFLEHPHFSIFPGVGVEVMPCLEIPR